MRIARPLYHNIAACGSLSRVTAADKITARLAELQQIRASYLEYQTWRVVERDHHGAWDAAINLSETECEMAGLQFALDAITAD